MSIITGEAHKVYLLSIYVIWIAALALFSDASASAASACIENPNATHPRGSHWYYRADRSTGRRCWFLAPENRAQRLAVMAKGVSPAAAVPLPSARPIVQFPTTTGGPEIPTRAMTLEDQEVPTHFLRGVSVLPSSVGPRDDDVVIAMIRKFGEPWAMELQDPWLREPIQTVGPILAAEQRPETRISLWQLLPFLALLIAFAAALTVFKLSAAGWTGRVAYQGRRPSSLHTQVLS